jgi:transposase
VLLAGDEASLYLQATLMRVWSVIGQPPVVKCDPGRSLTHFYGALNLTTGQETVMRTQLMNAAVSVLFLQKLLAAYPDQPILLLWDRAKWHQGPVLKAFLAAHPRLEIFFLPPASPDLNPQEQVWKATRQAISHNHLESKLEQLADNFERHLLNTCFPCSLLAQHGYFDLCAMFN